MILEHLINSQERILNFHQFNKHNSKWRKSLNCQEMNVQLNNLVLLKQIIKEFSVQLDPLWILESEEAAIDTGIVFQSCNLLNFFALLYEVQNNLLKHPLKKSIINRMVRSEVEETLFFHLLEDYLNLLGSNKFRCFKN